MQLIDASSFWQKMRKSLGSKRKELSPEHIEDITSLFGEFKEVRTAAAMLNASQKTVRRLIVKGAALNILQFF